MSLAAHIANLTIIRGCTDRISANPTIASDTSAVSSLVGYVFIVITTLVLSTIVSTLFF